MDYHDKNVAKNVKQSSKGYPNSIILPEKMSSLLALNHDNSKHQRGGSLSNFHFCRLKQRMSQQRIRARINSQENKTSLQLNEYQKAKFGEKAAVQQIGEQQAAKPSHANAAHYNLSEIKRNNPRRLMNILEEDSDFHQQDFQLPANDGRHLQSSKLGDDSYEVCIDSRNILGKNYEMDDQQHLIRISENKKKLREMLQSQSRKEENDDDEDGELTMD